MNKKAFTALMVAILLPLSGYLLVSYYSDRAVQMPRRYFYDSVNVSQKGGKFSYDTVWHRVENLHFTNQLGQQVSLDDLKGKILVIDFFFTHCPTICPKLAVSMKKLQNSFPNNDSIVQFVSLSIDPAHDSLTQLRKWASRFNINPDTWWLGTGNKDSIYNFAFNELKASVADSDIDTAFIHTENFFLLDKERVVRGWFNGLDSVAQSKLVRDIPLLMLEKDQKRSFKDFLKGLLKSS
ncbi:SCO family protein [Hanamia caeni]|jgi:protein SCO1/2|uniref:SCO family protein n=1 Tax=Hanamia caeni TaxID=2294116 RepID=A0A3M9N6D9_9BACT|nr:SCO family protein [Hanamia caeni]RNI33372.1 SCO family protein [Hanamia caeni]